jgi:hypothetical protein
VPALSGCRLSTPPTFGGGGVSESQYDTTPISILTLSNLKNTEGVETYRKILKNKGGIYSFVNTLNDRKYIGSAKDLYIRLVEHINNKKSSTYGASKSIRKIRFRKI